MDVADQASKQALKDDSSVNSDRNTDQTRRDLKESTILQAQNEQGETDESLMLKYQRGDYDAFQKLYLRHKAALFRFVSRQVSPPQSAEEIFQEIWLNIVKSAARYQPTAKFKTFLYQVAHNRIIDHYRSKDQRALDLYSDEESVAIEEQVQQKKLLEESIDQAASVQKLQALIAELPAPQKEVFLLKEESGLSLTEVSEAILVPMETVKSRYRYAVKKLREGLLAQTSE